MPGHMLIDRHVDRGTFECSTMALFERWVLIRVIPNRRMISLQTFALSFIFEIFRNDVNGHPLAASLHPEKATLPK